jgi:uncharacterized lipoprotein
MQQFVKILILLILSFVIVSCSSMYGSTGVIQNRGTDYLKARSIPPLNIPPGLSSSSIQEAYPVPDRYYPGSYKEISLIPPGL